MARGDDIEERLIDFAVAIILLCGELPNTPAGRHVAGQILRSGTSPAPNYGEARGAESRKDFIHNVISTGYTLALAHAPTPQTLPPLRALYDEAVRHYESAPEDAVAMSGQPGSPELAALTVVANAILNLDAFVMKD